MTWNIQWGRGADGAVDFERIAATIREMGEPEVMCMQEVAVNFPGLKGSSGEDGVALLSEAFPDYQPFYGIAIDVPDGKGGRSLFGNLLLSRLPVAQVFRHLLPWPPDPQVPSMQRMCLEALVKSPFGPFRVMITHLEYFSAEQRMLQVEELRNIHTESCAHAHAPGKELEGNRAFVVHPRPVSALLCGDFNFEPGAPEHERILTDFPDAPAFRDAWRLAYPDIAHAPTVGVNKAEWPDRPYCCDFIFLTEDLARRVRRVEVNRATVGSDHQPVVIELAD